MDMISLMIFYFGLTVNLKLEIVTDYLLRLLIIFNFKKRILCGNLYCVIRKFPTNFKKKFDFVESNFWFFRKRTKKNIMHSSE